MAHRDREKVTTGQRETLTGRPFAGMDASLPVDLPPGPESREGEPAVDVSPFRVRCTRKGNWPLSVERRSRGKVVTVVGNVQGDAAQLLALLKRRVGAGGAVRGEMVELQGDHRARVAAILDELGGTVRA